MRFTKISLAVAVAAIAAVPCASQAETAPATPVTVTPAIRAQVEALNACSAQIGALYTSHKAKVLLGYLKTAPATTKISARLSAEGKAISRDNTALSRAVAAIGHSQTTTAYAAAVASSLHVCRRMDTHIRVFLNDINASYRAGYSRY